MTDLAAIRLWTRRHPDLAELLLAAATTVGVVAVSLAQWGATDAGWARGLALGIPLGVLVGWVYRRRRRIEERRERELLEHRLRLARELHDAIAGQVTIVGVQAAAARRVLVARPDAAAEALERIEVASRTAVADLRRMLATLRDDARAVMAPPPNLDDADGLVQALRATGLDVTLSVEGRRPVDLPAALDQAAYRILQEATTNVVKHAPRATARILVRYGTDAVELRVTNGPGGPATLVPGAGLGILGMRERAALFGGLVTTGTTPDGGWVVDAILPSGGRAEAAQPGDQVARPG